jgi:hypothetical protein
MSGPVMRAIFATKRRIAIAVLFAVGIVVVAGLLADLREGENASKVINLTEEYVVSRGVRTRHGKNYPHSPTNSGEDPT